MDEITFSDLFSGIGGFRLGLERINSDRGFLQGQENEDIQERISDTERRQTWIKSDSVFRCVWSNDFNKYANQVYTARFGEANHHSGDIRGINAETIPDHDLLCAGFPCQAFSVAGKRHGFKDTRGTLFFEILRVAEAKRPRLLLLENVKGLLSHDGGRTFATILNALEELGYWWEYQVLNSKYFGVPQNRERVFIVGHLRGTGGREIFPITESSELSFETERVGEGISSCLDAHYAKGARKQRQFIEVQPLRFLNRNQKNFDDNAMTIDTTNSTGIKQGTKIRRLTPIECERLQGFPDNWTEGLSDTQRYKCLGNAVTVNVIEFLGQRILDSWG